MKKLNIIFEDNELLVINKQSGVLSIPDRQDPEKYNLYHILKQKYGDIYPVHRLDRDTSGLICFAKTRETHRFVSQQFEAGLVDKKYVALLKGNILPSKGDILLRLSPNKSKPGTMMVHSKGKEAITKYTVLEYIGAFSLVEIELLTGKTHQIRVHFKHLGYPLAVDPIYGSEEGIWLSNIKKKYNVKSGDKERPLMGRLPLHAKQLNIPNPRLESKWNFETELPKDLRVCIKQLKKYS